MKWGDMLNLLVYLHAKKPMTVQEIYV